MSTDSEIKIENNNSANTEKTSDVSVNNSISKTEKPKKEEKIKSKKNKPQKNELLTTVPKGTETFYKTFDDSIDKLDIEQILAKPKEVKQNEEIVIRVHPKDRKPIEQVKRFKPNAENGLTTKQVNTRFEEGYTNETTNNITKSYAKIILGTMFSFFNILCFIVAGALIAVKSFSNLMFLIVIIAHIVISIVQEIRAKNTVEKITLLTAPIAKVVRDGQDHEIKVSDIVLDDIIKLSLGNQISADCILIQGEAEVNESLLTGESTSIKKKAGDVLYAGSYVTSGKCLARVDKVGDDTYSSKLVAKAKLLRKNQSELLRNMKLITKIIAFIIIPLAVSSFFVNRFATGGNVTTTIEKTAGSIVGMIPAGMYLLTSMALAVGVIKLAKKKTLVQDLYSIEMLSRIDTLCLDKTGTITDGTMKVNTVLQLTSKENYTANDIIGSILTALDDNNQTSQALLAHFGYSRELTSTAILPFSSQRKLSAVTFKNESTYILGAPEFVMKKRTPEMDKQIKQYSQKGFRVLLLAKANGKIEGQKLPENRTPLYLIAIEDHIRESAYETIKWFKENDVAIKIISGDNPVTVSEISKRVGVTNASKFISLEGMNNKQVVEAANHYSVFGRVSPEQKCVLIKALKANGHKVAMTGDGVNDILALKEADCSIAMASGSEATRNVSNVVLLNSDFSSMPSVVAEGRRVVNNVSKSSSLFLMKTFFMFFVAIFCISLRTLSPFDTNQLFLLEFFVIGLPTFVLALQPNKDKIAGKFLSNVISRALPGAIIFSIIYVVCYFFNIWFDTGSLTVTTTMVSLGIFFAGLLILYRISKPFDIVRIIMILVTSSLAITVLIIVPKTFFKYETLSTINVLLLVCLIQFSGFIYNFVVKGCENLFNFKNKKKFKQ